MIISKTNLDIWYREYLNQRKKTAKYIKSRGGATRDTEALTRAEFEIDFRSEVMDNPKKTGKVIAQKMAKQDLFTLSHKEAERRAEAHAKQFGGSVNISLVMAYRLETVHDIWDAIEIRRAELKDDGLNTYRANIIIGQEFFGSPV